MGQFDSCAKHGETEKLSDIFKASVDTETMKRRKLHTMCLTSNSFEKKECNREYEQTCRSRDFLETWTKNQEWLYFEKNSGLMFCTICKKYANGSVEKACSFVTG